MVFLHGCASSGVITPSSPPPSISSLETEEVSYRGNLPCNDCDAINFSLDLYPDTETFSLTASYVEHPQNLPDEVYNGNWSVLRGMVGNPNAIVYKLTPVPSGQEYFYLRLNRNQIELISPNRERFEYAKKLRVSRSDTTASTASNNYENQDSNDRKSDSIDERLTNSFLRLTAVGYILIEVQGNKENYAEIVKSKINERLKDPDSAEYRNVTVMGEDPEVYICGELNARNSFGGYTGYKRFIANLSAYHPLGETAGDVLYPRLCR